MRIRQHASAVEAAKKAGVGHILYTGFAFAEKSSMSLAHVHLATEHAIRTTGIPFTFLRNALYTHLFVDPGLKAAVERGELVTSAGNGKLNTATRNDLALAAATVLAEEGHENKTYELTSPQSWTFDQLAQILSEVSGKKVTHRHATESDFKEYLLKSGLPEDTANFLVFGMYRPISRGKTASTSGDLQKLIGDSLTSLRESVKEALKS
ncbi:hypothetical protein skT53_34030 [Effusibacillus dendaii]|uniref:NmrA-like domain-containing protein n=1 Tax=Effusibacillus dendaii TaxID=2743772 RepID=A0A7I8DDZ3_9BACL|nr:hypothetical protein skT53_34030 [Effusibacillus dendaii]